MSLRAIEKEIEIKQAIGREGEIQKRNKRRRENTNDRKSENERESENQTKSEKETKRVKKGNRENIDTITFIPDSIVLIAKEEEYRQKGVKRVEKRQRKEKTGTKKEEGGKGRKKRAKDKGRCHFPEQFEYCYS